MSFKRTMAVVAVVAMMAILFVPMASDDSSAEITTDGITVVVPGHKVTESTSGDVITLVIDDIKVNNNKTYSIPVYITNVSANALNLHATGSSGNDLSVSTSSNKDLIFPGDVSDKTICTVTVDITAGEYAKSQTDTVGATIIVTDVSDGSLVTIQITMNVDVESQYYSEDAFNKFFGIFPNTLPEPLDNEWITAAVTLIIWIVATIVVSYLVIPLLTRLVGFRKSSEERKKLKKTLTKLITILMFVIAVNECAQIVGAGPEISHSMSTLSTILYVVIGAMIGWEIYMFIITSFFRNAEDSIEVDGFDTSLIPLFKMVGKLVLCVLGVAIILASFGVDLGGILMSAGVVSLGITLGAQSILGQFFSGIVLLATRPFKKGDYVKINDTVYIVRKVKLMYTEFNNWDKDQIITMPNNVVSAASIVNLTKDSKNTRIFVYMDVAYDTNLTLAKELMIKAAMMHPHVIKDGSEPMPGTRLTAFLDSGIEYRLACFVDDFDSSSHYAGQLREMMYKLFLDNDIEIPYNRLEVTMLEPCDGKKKPTDKTDD
ncbi:MAG: mechanosensitive ion channel family protein [Candidatus Methanomethylophilaceae archaeon]